MVMTEYETTMVIRPDISGDNVETTLDRIRDVVTKGGGKLLAINHWGKRKLAYEIKKHNRGIYVHTHYLGANDLVHEVERNLRISDNVLRFLTVKLAPDINPDERQVQKYVRPQYDSEEMVVDTVSEIESDRHGFGRGGEGRRGSSDEYDDMPGEDEAGADEDDKE